MKKILLLVCSVFLLSGSCVKDEWRFIKMKNNSTETIRICGTYVLPDTILPVAQLKTVKMLPSELKEITGYILDYPFKRWNTEKITLFVIDDQIFQTTSWDTIRKHNMVLKRYEINKQDYLNMQQKYEKSWALPYP